MSAGRILHHSILREYDIRGLVGETLDADDARAIGRGFGTLIARAGGSRAFTGYDGRLSSPSLEAALIEGLVQAGVDVDRASLGPTPMLYHSVHTTGADGGVMVTGSHNPPDYNGFKFMLGEKAFFGRAIRELGQTIADGDFASGDGRARDVPRLTSYVSSLAEAYRGERPLTVVWDAGNGAAGEAMAMLAGQLPGRHILLNERIDGTFPVHHPDPTVAENLEQLQESVLAEEADLGVAFDGDGDRLGIIDGKARILWGDQILALLAREVLTTHPGATVIADVKASQVLFDEISRLGGEPLMWQTGHSRIKSKMAETGAPLAGEMSGHIFFADRNFGYDDALYAAVRLISIVAGGADGLADLRDSLPALLNTPEIRFACPDDRKFGVVDEVKARLLASRADVETIDGVRVSHEGGWWLLRASNTQPVLVARIEAVNEEALARLRAELVAELEASDVEAPDMALA